MCGPISRYFAGSRLDQTSGGLDDVRVDVDERRDALDVGDPQRCDPTPGRLPTYPHPFLTARADPCAPLAFLIQDEVDSVGPGTAKGRHHQRPGVHPRVHRHPRAQPRQVHAPHDGQLEPDRAGRAPAALLRRLGRGRHDPRLAAGRQPLGGAGLRRARDLVPPRVQPPGAAGSQARRSGGPRRRTTAGAATTACWCRRHGRRPSRSCAPPG